MASSGPRWFSLLCLVVATAAFQPRITRLSKGATRVVTSLKSAAVSSDVLPTLTPDTKWQCLVTLNQVQDGIVTPRELSFAVTFVEDVGYEPPQGIMSPVLNEDDASKFVNSEVRNRWQLSEDPDDRKDGLWIWGLFEEPLYPFILLQLSFNSITMAGSDSDVIPSFTCFAQLSHVRDRKTGASRRPLLSTWPL